MATGSKRYAVGSMPARLRLRWSMALWFLPAVLTPLAMMDQGAAPGQAVLMGVAVLLAPVVAIESFVMFGQGLFGVEGRSRDTRVRLPASLPPWQLLGEAMERRAARRR